MELSKTIVKMKYIDVKLIQLFFMLDSCLNLSDTHLSPITNTDSDQRRIFSLFWAHLPGFWIFWGHTDTFLVQCVPFNRNHGKWNPKQIKRYPVLHWTMKVPNQCWSRFNVSNWGSKDKNVKWNVELIPAFKPGKPNEILSSF